MRIIKASSFSMIFCLRWCYYFKKEIPQLCKFLLISKLWMQVLKYKVHAHSRKFFVKHFLFPKKFSFQKLLQNTYFLENYPISPCQNELTRLLSMYSSLLSTEGERVWAEKKLSSKFLKLKKLQDLFAQLFKFGKSPFW